MRATRRIFFGFMGTAPLAAKAAAEAEIAKGIGMMNLNGLGNAGMGLPSGSAGIPQADIGPYVPYEKRLIGAADYINTFGLPKSVEERFRDDARHVHSLDPDIACKQSWSMSVKIITQRERNFQRAVERVHAAGWQERGRQGLKTLLGFDWPW